MHIHKCGILFSIVLSVCVVLGLSFNQDFQNCLKSYINKHLEIRLMSFFSVHLLIIIRYMSTLVSCFN